MTTTPATNLHLQGCHKVVVLEGLAELLPLVVGGDADTLKLHVGASAEGKGRVQGPGGIDDEVEMMWR